MTDVDRLIDNSLKGDKLSIARLISMVERGHEQAPYVMEKIYPYSGNAYYIGVTGPPGAGKSTTVDRLVKMFCENGYSVGVVAVDPSSPFTGGALLGDRVRMTIKPKKKFDVFFRSMSAGKVMGGLARTTKEASRILDACGKQIVIIETVGVGQSELDIAQATDTVIVIIVPESGDSIQIMKAGLMEIADIFVINKADRDGTAQLAGELTAMLSMVPEFPGGWQPPVIRIGNVFDTGPFGASLEELASAIGDHHRRLVETGLLGDRMRRKTMVEIHEALRDAILEPILQDLIKSGEMEDLAGRLLRKESDPYTLAEEVARRYLK